MTGHPWQPLNTAPTTPTIVIPAGNGIPWEIEQGPEVALLCWHDEHTGHVLIRSAWHMRDGFEGAWWDLECGERIDQQILGWVLLPTAGELEEMIEATGDGGSPSTAEAVG